MDDKAVETVRNMIVGFQEDHDNEDLTKYLSLFADDVHWYDHAFKICRVGRQAISGLRTAFLHCNQPFDAQIKSIEATPTGVVAEIIWLGRTTNDIVRPDGQVAVKATGKDFMCHVCMLFKVGSNNEIKRIDEYYNKQWDDGIDENKYHVMKGDSLKTDKN